MRVNTNVGIIDVTSAGLSFVDDDYQDSVTANEIYTQFSKSDLFWKIYEKIIIPTRKKLCVGENGESIRLFSITRDDTGLELYFHIDAYDEAYIRISDGVNMRLEEVVNQVYFQLREVLIDTELYNVISMEETVPLLPTEDSILGYMKRYVFYNSWIIE